MGLRYHVLKAGLAAVKAVGGDVVFTPITGGRGVILTMHHVLPTAGRGAYRGKFAPNRILEIDPDFLARTITRLRKAGYDIIPMDEVADRIANPNSKRFAVLTLDDGYRDNLEHAYPVMKAFDAPFTVYVSTGLPDGTANLWWRGIEAVVAKASQVQVLIEGEPRELSCETLQDKQQAYDMIYWWVRSKDNEEQWQLVKDLCARYDVDLVDLCRSVAMSWDEIGVLAQDSIVTIGAHTVSHPNLLRLSESEARQEMANSRDILASYLPYTPKHFSYPYGDQGSAGQREFKLAQELGFETAVTTRPGVIYAQHAEHMMALPRISLNGDFQAIPYLDALLSGMPTLMLNKGRRLNVA